MRKKILSLAIKYHGEYFKIKKAIKENEEIEEVNYEGNYITILDQDYPDCFKYLKYPPFIIFYEGDISIIKSQLIGVVGSRICCKEGIDNTKQVCKLVNPQYNIVSGLAKGIDGYAHKFAFDYQRKSIGVIGCGINVTYPKCNEDLYNQMKKEHLIISEYPNNTKPYSYHFPWRNRLIAALCESLIVCEAKSKSGTLISVNETIELNKEVYCFPAFYNQKDFEGCNQLIKEGANIICSEQDLKDI